MGVSFLAGGAFGGGFKGKPKGRTVGPTCGVHCIPFLRPTAPEPQAASWSSTTCALEKETEKVRTGPHVGVAQDEGARLTQV